MKAHRGTLALEDAEIVELWRYPAGQHVVRLRCAGIASKAKPGSFVHVTCARSLPMRRPISIMRVDAKQGWLDLLYKEVGTGTRALAKRTVGETLSLLGPVGEPFRIHEGCTRPLLIGGGVGIPPILFLAERLKQRSNRLDPLMLMGSEVAFPFELTRTDKPVPGVDADVDATLAVAEQLDIPTRLSSLGGFPGCHRGYVTDLARGWLDALTADELVQVAIYSCGPTPMLRAVAALANEFDLRCQVSLEEYMACAVGGCAGCTVRVRTRDGEAMKRVCVDGPVFEANDVFFDT